MLETQSVLCRWEAPDGAGSVLLSSHLMDELRRETLRAYLSLPKRGAEIGGLLLGHIRREGQTVFQIDLAEDVPCEHRFGPSYKLSEADYDGLRERLVQHRREVAVPVIGFYRSYTGKEVVLDRADQELVEQLFPDAHLLWLLLRPISAEKCQAQFQFVTAGELVESRPYEPFLFEAAHLEAVGEIGPEASETKPAKLALIEPLEPAVESSRPVLVMPTSLAVRNHRWQDQDDDSPSAPRRSPRWLPVLLCVLAAIAGGSIYELWTIGRQPRWAPLGLDATTSDRDLQLSWDSAAPAIEQAARGLLSVTEGPTKSQIQLTAAQLRAGKFRYRPSNASPLFQLTVYDAGDRTTGDSLRVANVHVTNPAPAPVPAPPPTPVAEQPLTGAPVDDTAAAATAPAVRHQVLPDIPAGIRARIRERTVVPVQVHINASGRVTSATANEAGDGLDRYLADQAVKAARQWTFAPAHSANRRAVASVKTVEFVFSPAQ